MILKDEVYEIVISFWHLVVLLVEDEITGHGIFQFRVYHPVDGVGADSPDRHSEGRSFRFSGFPRPFQQISQLVAFLCLGHVWSSSGIRKLNRAMVSDRSELL